MLIFTELVDAEYLFVFSLSTNILITSITSQKDCSVSHVYGLTVHIKSEVVPPYDFFFPVLLNRVCKLQLSC